MFFHFKENSYCLSYILQNMLLMWDRISKLPVFFFQIKVNIFLFHPEINNNIGKFVFQGKLQGPRLL